MTQEKQPKWTVDISQFLGEKEGDKSSSQAEKSQQLQEDNTNTNSSTETPEDTEELIKYLQEQDPTLALLASHIFHQGAVLNDVIQKMHQIEHHVGYLLSKDPEVAEKIQQQQQKTGAEDESQ